MTHPALSLLGELPNGSEPREVAMTAGALYAQLYEPDLGALAEFQGIGYRLAVYLLGEPASGFSYALTYAEVSGPPAAMQREMPVRIFGPYQPGEEGEYFARACLYALREAAGDLDSEVSA